MNEVIFAHGVFSPKYEQQAKEQGYTLGDKDKEVEKLRDAINILFMHDVLTDSQRWSAFRRLQSKVIVPNLQKMEGAEK